MQSNCTYLSYQQTGYFSKLVTDYITGDKKLEPLYKHAANITGIQNSIEERKKFPQQRSILVQELIKQYKGVEISAAAENNIQWLLDENTFTVTTAHQPNIFTGPLFFVYKILHAIQLAGTLQKQLPAYKFVPVYYMGSEDADFDELNNITICGQRYEWHTKQTGAVGRMKVDKSFTALLHALHGQLGVLPFGEEIMEAYKKFYTEGTLVQDATLQLVNHLFGKYGLVVLIPDNAELKKVFRPVVEKELREGFSYSAVLETIAVLDEHYKVQAAGRELNLFYLTNDQRLRIEKKEDGFFVEKGDKFFTIDEILNELEIHPERFSANVILRGVFQETILPNIAFIGGGGELAYWLELKKVFEAAAVPYPVLVLRNSLLLCEGREAKRIQSLGISYADIFLSEHELMNKLVALRSNNKIVLNGELQKAADYYDHIMHIAGSIDKTLVPHTEALKQKAIKRLEQLEQKMLRAEKRKFTDEQQQIQKVKQVLFPANNLQERIENISGFYANYGPALIDELLRISLSMDQQFTIAEIKK